MAEQPLNQFVEYLYLQPWMRRMYNAATCRWGQYTWHQDQDGLGQELIRGEQTKCMKPYSFVCTHDSNFQGASNLCERMSCSTHEPPHAWGPTMLSCILTWSALT